MEDSNSKTLAQEILDKVNPIIPESFGLTQSQRFEISNMVEGFVRTEIAHLGPNDDCSHFSLSEEGVKRLESKIKVAMYQTNTVKQKVALKHFKSLIKDWERYIQCSGLIKTIQFSANEVARSLKATHELPM